MIYSFNCIVKEATDEAEANSFINKVDHLVLKEPSSFYVGSYSAAALLKVDNIDEFFNEMQMLLNRFSK